MIVGKSFLGSKHMKSNVFMRVIALCSIIFVAGCLPEENKTNTSSAAGDVTTAQAKMDYVAQSMSSYALRSQYELAKNDKWRTGTYPEGKISMSGVDMGGAADIAISAFCRDSASRGFHLTWSKDNSAGGQMMTALSRRVASDSLGMVKEGGKIATQAGKEILLSAACKTSISSSMKSGAPVIVMALSMPSNTDMAGQTKVLFETVACDGVREKGYKMVKVVTKYDAAGKVMAGYPQRSAEGSSCVETSIANADTKLNESSILSNAGGFGSGGIADLLKDNLGNSSKIACANAKQEIVTGYDSKGRPITKTIEVANSCNSTQVETDKIKTMGDADAGGDGWEPNDEVGVCQGGTGSNGYTLFDTPGLWSWTNWDGLYTSKRWNDYVTVTSQRGDEQVTETQIVRGPWVGDTIDCRRDEKFKANCADIPPVKALGKPYASNDLWVNVDVLNNSSWHFDNDWIDDLFGSTIACWFGCDKLIMLNVTMMNRDYFDGLEVSGELHMWREAKITYWDNYEKFKPHVPSEWEKMKWKFDAEASTCAVSIRTPLFTCSGDGTVHDGSNPEEPGATNVLLHGTIADLYNSYPRTADGAVMTTLDRSIDFQYLILDGKYPSDYSIGSLTWAIKSCGIKGCDTDYYYRPVYRFYIDADKKGYQRVRDQGFYYTNKKVMYDENAGFYMTDLSITPSENSRTRCEVVRLPERTQHDLKYKVAVQQCGGSDDGCWTSYEDANFHAEFIKRDLNNYYAQTPTKGFSTATERKNICTEAKGGGYYGYGTTVKYCDKDPYAGKTSLRCEDIGLYTRRYCTSWHGGDDGSCRTYSDFCDNHPESYYQQWNNN